MPRPRVDTERILDAALVALTRSGVARLTLVDVAAEAGISRHTLHRRYRSMAELLDAAAEHLRARVERGIAAAAPEYCSPRQRLEAVAAMMYDLTVQAPFDRFLELEPDFYLGFVRGHFDQWVRSVGEALASPRGQLGPDARLRRAAAELLLRQTASYQVVPPAHRASAVGALVEGAWGLMEGSAEAALSPSARTRRAR